MSDATAILIFAQPAGLDATHKRVASQPLFDRQVIRRLNNRVRQTARGTRLPVLHSTDLIDHTGTFGGQLTDALRATFALGYERVLVIGNDCPALTTAGLTQAAERLRSAPVVLGPDQRGGLYLFGLSRDVFEQVSMASLPWQTDRLARAVYQVCAAWPAAVLPPLGDLNSRDDLRHYRSTSPAVALFITRLLNSGTAAQTSHFSPHHTQSATTFVGSTGSLRAPPAFRATVAVL